MTPSPEAVFSDLLRAVDTLLPVKAGGRPDESRERPDVVAGLLSYLARRMTEVTAAREAETASFLSWLEGRIGCPVEALRGKDSVLSCHEQPGGVDTLLDVLASNYPVRVRVNVAPAPGYGASNPDRDLIVEGYERSVSRLGPLVQELALTDRLIDLIVYRLYGLTPDEAGLVDRATGFVPEDQPESAA